MPREKTLEEIRNEFLSYCHRSVDSWANWPDLTVRKRLEGVVFSLLVALDGEAGGLPRFKLIPDPHEEDLAFHFVQNEDWYPPSTKRPPCDISGGLHDQFARNTQDTRVAIKT